jgi:hypothetical protein
MIGACKICCRCRQSKPLSEFHKNNSAKDGLAKRCKICSNFASEASRSKHYKRSIHNGHKPSAHNGFALNPTTGPTLHPTVKDIAWAAGIYEGEGSIWKSPQCGKYRGLKITVPQKEPWILYRLRNLFGGKVSPQTGRTISLWRISGDRALGFSETIYVLLSPHRQQQLRTAWGIA